MTWTPGTTAAANTDIVLRLQDSRGGVAIRVLTVEVAGGNHAAQIDAVQDIVLAEGEILSLPLTASDADGDALTLTVRNLPPGAAFDAATGVLTWKPGYDQAGLYEGITVVASDGKSISRRSFKLTVEQGYAKPVLAPMATQTLREGDKYALQLAGSMPGGLLQKDGTTITLEYSAPWLPGGATLNSKTGWIEWTPGYSQHGSFTVPVTLTATYTPPGGDTVTTEVTQNVVFNVLNANGAPVFDAVETWNVLEGSPLRISVFAFDPDNPSFEPRIRLNPLNPNSVASGPETTAPTVTYAVTGLPEGARFDSETLEVIWTPEYDQAGTYYVHVLATDDGDGTGTPKTSEITIPIVVTNANRAPVIGDIAAAFVDKGAVLEIPFTATDIDGNPITFTVSGLPSFATYVQGEGSVGANGRYTSGGTLRFAPGEGQRGDYAITITAQDNGSGSVNQVLAQSKTFVLTVRSETEAPQLAMPGQVVAAVGQPIHVPISVRDLDQDALSFSAIDLPAGATLTPSTQYGQAILSWTPTEDDVRIHDLQVVVTDSGLGPQDAGFIPDPDAVITPNQRTQSLRIVVRSANQAPAVLAITADGATINSSQAITAVGATEGVPLSLSIFAQDSDADVLNWSISSRSPNGEGGGGLPPGLVMDVAAGGSQATLRWTPSMFAAQDGGGVYRITVTAGDGAAQVTQDIDITVANVNQAPRILPMPLQLVQEGQTMSVRVLAADVDGDATRLALLHDENTPEGLLFDANSGYLEWTPGQNVVNNAIGSSQAFTLNFTASDGAATTTQSVQVRVLDVNRPAVLQVSNHALAVGQSFSLPVLLNSLPLPLGEGWGEGIRATDPDGAPPTANLAISFADLPEGASYDAQAKRLVWTPGPGQVGDYTVTAKAWDGFNTTTQTFTLRVVADTSANEPSVLVSTTPSTPAQPGQLVVATIRASSYSAMQSIAVQVQGLNASDPQAWSTVALDGAGRFKFTPTAAGLVNIQVMATDVDGFSHTEIHGVRVKDPADSQAPVLGWAGVLNGATATSQPVTIRQLSTLAASLQEQQLMGYKLEISAAGSGSWQNLAAQSRDAANQSGTLNLASLDPAAFANGVYSVRLSAWDLQGRTSEINARVIIDSAAKTAPQAVATDATFTLAGHAFALTRTLSSLPPPPGEGGGGGTLANARDFGNWQLAGFTTHLTTDQPDTDAQGLQAPWSEGARLWITAPALDGTTVANLQFTLGTYSERLGNVAGAPVVVRPVFTNNQGWSLQARSGESFDAQSGFITTQPEALQRQGNRLYDQLTGLPWVPDSYTLTGPDGTRYQLDAQGRVTTVQFADGASWLVSDAGIAAVQTAGGDATEDRVNFIRDTEGRISLITSAAASFAYRYDASGRLILARNLSSLPPPSGEGGGGGTAPLGTPYGYDNQGRLLQDPLTANFGAALNWNSGDLANGWSGTLQPGATTSLAFTIRESEIASTIKTPGAQGSVIVAIQSQGGGALQVTGATVLGTSTDASTQTTLVRITEAGLKLIRLTGEGQASIKIALAGDINRDSLVDGADSQAWEQTPSDIDGDGQATQADRQILYANYGLRANQAPVSLLPPPPGEGGGGGTLRTHTDLATRASLNTVAQDLEGDSIYWRVLGATHGTATLSADGQSIVFMPEVGYAGPATITVQADDGFAAAAPMELAVNVSGSRLLTIHVARLAALATGGTGQLVVTGDFEDEEGVALTGNYAQYTSSDSSIISVSSTGAVRGLSDGIALVQVHARGIEGVNVFTVSAEGHGPGLDDNGFEVDVYPRAITLPLLGQRQLKVKLPNEETGLPTNISAASAGTRYFVSDASIAEIAPDGLIFAKATGTVTVSVVHQGRQHDITLNVQQAQIGSAVTTAKGGVAVQDSEGNLLMVAPGALPAGTTVSISGLALEDVGIALPGTEVLDALAAVSLDFGDATLSLPAQLAIKVTGPIDSATGQASVLEAGTEVMFWRKGTILDTDGIAKDTWWLVDNGFIGTDGMARTASPPYSGVTGGNGVFLVTTLKNTPEAQKAREQTGEIRVIGAAVDFNAIWAAGAMMAVGLGGGGYLAGAALGVVGAVTAGLTAVGYTLDGSFKRDIPKDICTVDRIFREFPAPPNLRAGQPVITAVEYDPNTRKLTLRGTNFVPDDQSFASFDMRVWLEPRGGNLEETDEADEGPTNGLVWRAFAAQLYSSGTPGSQEISVTLPDNILLSQHDIYIERRARVPTPTGFEVPVPSARSQAIGLWQLKNGSNGQALPSTDMVVASSSGLTIYTQSNSDAASDPTKPKDQSLPIGLQPLKHLTTDENGQPLQLAGYRTEPVAYMADASLAFVAGRDGRVYVVDMLNRTVAKTLVLGGSSAGTNIVSLAVANGWLYAAEGSNYAAGSGRLMRISVDPVAQDFLHGQQQLSLGGLSAPMGFGDMAVSMDRYLAVTSLRAPLTVSGGSNVERGNVYVIDLEALDENGAASTGEAAVVTLDAAKLGAQDVGRAPQYVTAGLFPAEFVISSAKDHSRGISSVRVALNEQGGLAGGADLRTLKLTPALDDPQWLQKKHQQNIQRAADSVVVTFEGKTYALVADYNFIFNDAHFSEAGSFGYGKQIGGKIGVIEDPFGRSGPPRYLGATTPIVGGAVNSLSIGAGGELLADVWIEEDTANGSRMYESLFVWNANALVSAAVRAADRPQSLPIDRDPGNSVQIVAPLRYDQAVPNTGFGWIYGTGTHLLDPAGVVALTAESLPALANADALRRAKEVPLSSWESALVRAGAASVYAIQGISAALSAMAGRDTSEQIKAMNEARKTLKLTGYDYATDSSEASTIAFSLVEGIIGGFGEVGFEVADVLARIVAVASAVVREGYQETADFVSQAGEVFKGQKSVLDIQWNSDITVVPPDLPALSELARMVEAGAPIGEVLKQIVINAVSSNAAGAGIVSAYALQQSVSAQDKAGMIGAALGMALGARQAVSAVKKAHDAAQRVVDAGLKAPQQVPAAMAALKQARLEAQQALLDQMRNVRRFTERVQNNLKAKATRNTETSIGKGPLGDKFDPLPTLTGTAVWKDQRMADLMNKAIEPRIDLADRISQLFKTSEYGSPFGDWRLDGPNPIEVIKKRGEPATGDFNKTVTDVDEVVRVKVIIPVRDNGVVVDHVSQTIDLVVRSEAGINKHFEARASKEKQAEIRGSVMAGYELPYTARAGTNGREYVSYDSLRGKPMTIHLSEELMTRPYGLAGALVHERVEIGATLNALRRRGPEGLEKAAIAKVLDDAIHQDGIDLADYAAAEAMLAKGLVSEQIRVEKVREIFKNIKDMSDAQTDALKKEFDLQRTSWMDQIEIEAVRRKPDGTYEPVKDGRLDFLIIENGKLRVVEAKSTYANEHIANDKTKLKGTLTPNQSDYIPAFLSDPDVVLRVKGEAATRLRGDRDFEEFVNDDGTLRAEKDSVLFAVRKYGGEGRVEKYSPELLTDAPPKPRDVWHTVQAGDLDNPQLTWVLSDGDGALITDADAQRLADAAKAYWTDVGVPAELLDGARFELATLPQGVAGLEQGEGRIALSINGAGYGWFVDGTPLAAEEFTRQTDNTLTAEGSSSAANKLDLLTVMIHELGHVLGFGDTYAQDDVMNGYLSPGMRRLPDADDVRQWIIAGVDNAPADSATVRFSSPNASAAGASAQHQMVSPLPVQASFDAEQWQATGNTTLAQNLITLAEAEGGHASVSQSFVLGEEDRFLSFTVDRMGLQGNASAGEAAPQDAFEVALLNATTGASVLAPAIGLSRSDAIVNTQLDGAAILTTRTTTGVRHTDNADGSRTYVIDLRSVPPSTPVQLSFDLIGFGAGAAQRTSQVVVRDIRLVNTPVAVDDTATLAEDTLMTIDSRANDVNGSAEGFTPQVVTQAAHGNVTIAADGSFIYTPQADYTGADSFTYRLAGDAGEEASNVATISLHITPVNDAPVAASFVLNTTEDAATRVELLATDVDSIANELRYIIEQDPAHGVLTRMADGSYSYQPDANYFGLDSFAYKVNDGELDSAVATVTINVAPVNDVPTLGAQTLTVVEDTELAGNLLATAADIDSASLTALIVGDPAHGTLTVNPDGTFSYQAHANYNGPDSFTYIVNDGELTSNVATVSINVTAVNDAPTLGDQHLDVAEDTELTGSLLATGADVDSATLMAAIVAGPVHGTVTLNADGSFSYRANPDYNGADSFTYRVSDGELDSGTATVAINVTAVNDAPTVTDQAFSVAEDGVLEGSFFATVADVDSTQFMPMVLGHPSHGTLTVNADGSFRYEAHPDYFGSDDFLYVVSDGALTSNMATIRIDVRPVNDAPTLVSQSLTVAEDTPLTGSLLAFAVDIDSDNLSVTIVSGPAYGTLTLNTDGTFSYQADPDYNGPDSFTYKVNDGELESNVATVTIDVTAVNDAPTLADQHFIVAEDAAVSGNLIDSASDVDNATLSAEIVTGPAHGTLTVNADGTFTYRPNANYNGPDSFTYKVSDGQLQSGVATVSIDVAPVNDAPSWSSVAPASFQLTPITGADTSGIYQAGASLTSPAGTPTRLSFDFTADDTALHSEFGIFRVDDATGRIGNLMPGNPGYAAAALSSQRSTLVFASGRSTGARKSVDVLAGQYFGTYLVKGGSSGHWRAKNPANDMGAGTVAFLSVAAANADSGFDHVKADWTVGNTGTAALALAWEDTVGGGDRDYNDAVINVTGLQATRANAFVYDARAVDLDGDALTYALSQGPVGAVIDAITGRLTWLDPIAGLYSFVIDVSDGNGGTAQQRFTLEVR
ncbi:Ig-like domain-containing protein [Ramlibacter sp. WS9]|uniref:Ig-like domain-containing protein n=1 Tax=Ramlibacter sp. WS9 TaxID=1882741 RepID=UPI001141ECD0|nr:Ig-like domain-containing protein [Ramlibacter sp. WS9]ROZ61645.1 tandem-95 repeat protein [Ramlibacter sp. WS9]